MSSQVEKLRETYYKSLDNPFEPIIDVPTNQLEYGYITDSANLYRGLTEEEISTFDILNQSSVRQFVHSISTYKEHNWSTPETKQYCILLSSDKFLLTQSQWQTLVEAGIDLQKQLESEYNITSRLVRTQYNTLVLYISSNISSESVYQSLSEYISSDTDVYPVDYDTLTESADSSPKQKYLRNELLQFYTELHTKISDPTISTETIFNDDLRYPNLGDSRKQDIIQYMSGESFNIEDLSLTETITGMKILARRYVQELLNEWIIDRDTFSIRVTDSRYLIPTKHSIATQGLFKPYQITETTSIDSFCDYIPNQFIGEMATDNLAGLSKSYIHSNWPAIDIDEAKFKYYPSIYSLNSL